MSPFVGHKEMHVCVETFSSAVSLLDDGVEHFRCSDDVVRPWGSYTLRRERGKRWQPGPERDSKTGRTLRCATVRINTGLFVSLGHVLGYALMLHFLVTIIQTVIPKRQICRVTSEMDCHGCTGVNYTREGTSLSCVAGSPKVVIYSSQAPFFVFSPYVGSIARIYHLFSVSVYIRNLFSISFHYLFFAWKIFLFYVLYRVVFNFIYPIQNFATSFDPCGEASSGLEPCEHCGRRFEPRCP